MLSAVSVDLASHGVMGVAASGGVVGRCPVAQCRVPVAVVVVVVVLEIPDHDAGLEQGGPMVAVEAFLP